MKNPSIPTLPDLNKIFMVETYASLIRVETILTQEGHIITFISNSMGPKQQAMSVNKRKMMDILYVVIK
jgi:hypothetical protein